MICDKPKSLVYRLDTPMMKLRSPMVFCLFLVSCPSGPSTPGAVALRFRAPLAFPHPVAPEKKGCWILLAPGTHFPPLVAVMHLPIFDYCWLVDPKPMNLSMVFHDCKKKGTMGYRFRYTTRAKFWKSIVLSPRHI